MQSATAALIAAIAATERRPTFGLSVDWDNDGHGAAGTIDDLTGMVTSVTVDRQLKGDLPDQVRLVEGVTSAQLTADLAGDPDSADSAARYFSRFNTAGPLYGKERLHRPVTYQVGMRGAEMLPAFTGRTSALPVDSGAGTAQLVALDHTERLRQRVTLPTVVADDLGDVRPGLTGAWLMDWVLRRNGFYATPGLRDNCVFSATMRGSAYPEVGTVVEVHGVDGPPTFTPDPTDGTYSGVLEESLLSAGVGGGAEAYIYSFDGELSVNDGRSVLIEFTNLCTVGLGGTQGIASLVGTDGDLIGLWTDGGNLTLGVNRDGSGAAWEGTLTGPAEPGYDGKYVAVHLRFTAGTVYVTWRIDGTTTTGTIASGSQTERPPLTVVKLTQSPTSDPTGTPIPLYGVTGPVQITTEPSTTATFPGPWNNAFVPTATLDPSLNRITGVLPSDARDSAGLLAELAGAEQGMLTFDETGHASFRNRSWWSGATGQTVQRTLTAEADITDLAYDDNLESLRNRVTARATPVVVSPTVIDVWTSQPGVPLIARGGSTVLWVEFEQAVVDLDTFVRYNAFGIANFSRVALNTKADGSGTNWTTGGLGFTFDQISATTVKLTIRNHNPATLYLTPAGGGGGLILAGRTVTADTTSRTRAEAIDLSSADPDTGYGEQVLDLPDNPWRQDYESTLSLVQEILGQTAWPRPVLTSVSIVADPRLQLGDRTRFVDRRGIALDGEYWLTGITTARTADGKLSQRVTARQATTTLLWGVGAWGVNTWG